jgi:hypothetical protein
MELEIILLSEVNQAQKPDIACFCSFLGSRPKMVMMLILTIIIITLIRYECEGGII